MPPIDTLVYYISEPIRMSTRSSNTTNFAKGFASAISDKHHGIADTKIPQTAPLKGHVANNGGGYCFTTTDEVFARRLVIMGTTKSTYYSSAQKLTDDAVTFMSRMVDEGKGLMILNTLRDAHESGSAPKMTMTMAILGFLTRCKDDAVRKAALDYTVVGLRTLSQLYMWLSSHMASGHGKGFGRGPKTVLTTRFHNNSPIEDVSRSVMMTDPRRYYPGMTAMQFAYQATKYAQRGGISASDVVSLVHPKPTKTKRVKTVRKNVNGKVVYEPIAGTGGETAGYVPWPLAKRVVLAYVKNDLSNALHCALQTLDSSAEAVPKTSLMEFSPTAFAAAVAGLDDSTKEVLTYLWACDRVKTEGVEVDLALQLVKEHNLPREVLATSLLTERRVWISLLLADSSADELKVNMPITALIRNLGVMSARGLFDTSTGNADHMAFTRKVVAAVSAHLTNKDVIVRGRVHPASVVSALKTYEAGKGLRGSSTWPVCSAIVTALNSAVDIAFHTVQSTGQDELHFIDVSASMTWPDRMSAVEGLQASDAASIQMLTHLRAALRSGDNTRQIVGTFSSGSRIVYDNDPDASAVKMNPRMSAELDRVFNSFGNSGRSYHGYGGYGSQSVAPTHNLFDPLVASFKDVWTHVHNQPAAATDCAQPIVAAIAMAQSGVARPSVIYVYTDNETNCGSIHPTVAMKEYRKIVPNAKLVVIAATPTNVTIADPNDSGMLDVAGFDVGAADVIHDFAKASSSGVDA